jgi:hypothetical protein
VNWYTGSIAQGYGTFGDTANARWFQQKQLTMVIQSKLRHLASAMHLQLLADFVSGEFTNISQSHNTPAYHKIID